MSLSTRTFRRLGATLVLGAAIATVTAPQALAHHQDVGVATALQQIQGAAAAPDAVDRYLRSHSQAATGEECDAVCRYLAGHEQGVALGGDTHARDAGAPLPAAAPTTGSGWTAGDLAAASSSGLVVILLAGTVLVVRRRRSVIA